MKKTGLFISALLLLAVGCSKKAPDTDTTQKAFVAEAAVEKEFINGCVDSALELLQQSNPNNLTKNDIDKLCLCNLGYIRERYSVAQMEALDKANNAEKEAFFKLAVEAGFACGKNLGKNPS